MSLPYLCSITEGAWTPLGSTDALYGRVLQDDDMTERTPPDSPHVRSGVSSFSHISSPQSYQFSRDGDASDEEGSSWSSDEVCNSL